MGFGGFARRTLLYLLPSPITFSRGSSTSQIPSPLFIRLLGCLVGAGNGRLVRISALLSPKRRARAAIAAPDSGCCLIRLLVSFVVAETGSLVACACWPSVRFVGGGVSGAAEYSGGPKCDGRFNVETSGLDGFCDVTFFWVAVNPARRLPPGSARIGLVFDPVGADDTGPLYSLRL